MAPLPFTGTIGATSAANVDAPGASSSRRAMPEPVTVFGLPIERREYATDLEVNTGKKRPTRRKRQSEIDTRSQSRAVDAADDDGEAGESGSGNKTLSIDDSLALVQSLRQSRLIHLTAMLPYLSTRHRTATRYHPPPKDHPYPGGLDAAAFPHSLSHLGRADVRIGPLLFPRTRFGEARVEGGVSEAEGKAILRGEVVAPVASTSSSAMQPSNTTPAKAAGLMPPIQTPPRESNAPAAGSSAGVQPTAATPSTPVATTAAPTSVQSSAPNTPVGEGVAEPVKKKGRGRPRKVVAAPPAPVHPPNDAAPSVPASHAPPNINGKVVQAVSAAAARNPALQNLLQAAANGKANPEQLRHLANFIATVSENLEKAAREAAASATASAGAPVTTEASTDGPLKKPKQKRGPRKSKMEGASPMTPEKPSKMLDAESPHDSPAAPRVLSAPAQAIIPWYPPVVTVEFRENPSGRFILPLWRGAIVERRVKQGERSIKVTILLPANGSAAAIRASGQDPVALDKAQAKSKTKGKKKQKEAEAADAADEEQNEAEAGPSFTPHKPPSMAELKAPPSVGAETHAVTWLISSCEDSPISDALWNIFGRVESAKTFVDGVEQHDVEVSAPEASADVATKQQTAAQSVAIEAILKRLHANWQQYDDGLFKPKLQLTADEVSKDLAEHLSDKFAPKEQVMYSRPIVRLKRAAGEEDDVEVLRSVQAAAIGRVRTIKANKDNKSDDEDEEMDEAENAGNFSLLTGMTGTAPIAAMPVEQEQKRRGRKSTDPDKPKRKRHVAKFNDDGTLKLCQACGTNATPMWRRGPAGKSTLCNACGAKWKVGRLVMPDQPPMASPGTLRRAQAEGYM